MVGYPEVFRSQGERKGREGVSRHWYLLQYILQDFERRSSEAGHWRETTLQLSLGHASTFLPNISYLFALESHQRLLMHR